MKLLKAIGEFRRCARGGPAGGGAGRDVEVPVKVSSGRMRIVSDGHRFKVQEYVRPFWLLGLLGLWSDHGKYEPIGRIFTPRYYETEKEAREAIELTTEYRAKLHKWQEVSK